MSKRKTMREKQLLKAYNKFIRITDRIDKARSKRDPEFAKLPKNERYRIIHEDIGVETIFKAYEFFSKFS